MNSVVAEKRFVWKFIDEVTQGVKHARQAMQDAKSAAQQTGTEVKESSSGWTDYGDKAKDAADKAKSAMKQVADASRNGTEAVEKSIDRVKDAVEKVPRQKVTNLKAKVDDSSLKGFERQVRDVPKEKSLWLRIKDGFSNSLHNAQHEADNTKHSFSILKSVMAGTFLGNAALQGIQAIGSAMGGLIKVGWDYNAQQQTMKASWDTLTGSASKGQAMVDMTNKLATSAQNSTAMVNELNQKLYAVTNNADKTRNLSKAMLTLQDAFNVSDASLENFATQWSQMVGNGKASAQDMLSIQNVFPKFRGELLDYERKVTHNKNLTMKEMNDMMSKGQISSDAMNHVLLGMGHEYKNATNNFSSTLNGMIRTAKSAAPRILGPLMAPLTNAANPILKAFSKWMADPKTEKAAQKLGKQMQKDISSVANTVGKITAPFKDLIIIIGKLVGLFALGAWKSFSTIMFSIWDAVKFVADGFSKLWSPVDKSVTRMKGLGPVSKIVEGLGGIVGGVAGTMVAFAGAVKIVTGAIKVWHTVTKAMTIAQAALDVVLNLNPIGLTVIAVTALIAGLVLLYKKCKPFREFVNGIGKEVAKMAKEVVNWFKKIGKAIGDSFTGKAQWEKDLGRQFKNLNKAFDNDAKAFQKKLRKWNTDLWNGMTGNAKWEKDLRKKFDSAKKDYDRYSKQQLKSDRMMQRERQKNWNNFWSGLSKKSRSAWNDMSKYSSNGMQGIRSAISKHSKNVSRTWDNTWSTMKKITVGAWQVIRQHSSNGMETVRGAISSGMSRVSSIWNSGWNSMANFFKGIWSGIKQAAADGMNGVINVINAAIGGINKVWSFFTGHGTGLSNIGHVHFAQGGVVRRHLSVINDGDGPDWKELVQMPDGGLFMSQERNWTGFLPEGTRIYSGPETRQIMNAVGVSHYASGGIVGDIGEGIDWAKGSLENLGSWMGDKIDAIMDFLDDPLKAVKGLLKKATDGMTDKLGHYGELATGALDKLTQPISDWFKKNLEPILDKLEEANPGGAGVARWRPFIKRAAKMEGIALTSTMMQKMLTQINTESGGNPGAIGGTDGLADGHATGLLQFKPGTFRSWIWHGHGNIMNGFDQILAAFNALQHGGEGGWGNFGIPGKGWATGGEITSQQFGWVGDNPQHHEFVLNPYAPSAEPLLDRAFEATADAQPSGQSGQAGNSKLDRMIELLEILVANVEGLDLNVSLDGEAIRRYNNKENAKEWQLRKG